MSGTISSKSLIGELKRKRAISSLAGKLTQKEMLVDVALLEREYFQRRPKGCQIPRLVRGNARLDLCLHGRLTCALGNKAPLGGLKVVTANGWFAARPCGTENDCKSLCGEL